MINSKYKTCCFNYWNFVYSGIAMGIYNPNNSLFYYKYDARILERTMRSQPLAMKNNVISEMNTTI